MTKLVPSSFCNASTITRAKRSSPDPGPSPSTMVVVRGGQSCAATGVASAMAVTVAMSFEAREICRICAPSLGMHVLGEPVGWHLVAEPALLRLAVDDGAGGGELIAQPDIVDEASHLCSRGAAFDPAGDELRQSREPLEVDLLGELPAAALHGFLDRHALGRDVNGGGVVPMDDHAVGALDRRHLDLRSFD